MLRSVSWIFAWALMLIWCVAIRPFVPGLLPIEPCVPLLVVGLMLGPLRIVLPLTLLAGLVFDAFQPFPQPLAFIGLIGISGLVGLAVRFILATRSFYSALILVLVSRIFLAGLVYLLGPGGAVWPAEKAVLSNPIFFLVTLLVDALFLLIGFRLASRPLLGAKRVQIAR